MSTFQAIIGLECHAQLATASKMFCACPVVNDAPPNTAICEVCMGHPGTLPAPNARAVALGLRIATALGCTLQRESVFARKHYFYPDLPKGYQITQYDRPFATGGRVLAGERPIHLTRIHFEEDAGKMIHGPDGTLVDWNRAGVPLVEIVSEPEIQSPEEAESYLRTLHRVLVESGVCSGDMEKGHFRCDANVSVARPDEPWGTRVEIKNVNSFRFVAKAIRYEIDRQIRAIESGERVEQETRTWSVNKTVPLRKKEGSADYRYFREPDLPVLRLTEAEIGEAAAALPGVPLDEWLARRDRERVEDWTRRYGLTPYDVGVILGDTEAAAFFEAAVAAGTSPRAAANVVTSEVLRRGGPGRLTAEDVAAVEGWVEAGRLTRDAARRVVDALWHDGGRPDEIVRRLRLDEVVDTSAIEAAIARVLAEHPAELSRYRSGAKGVFGFFMGRLMAVTERKADPNVATPLLRKALDGETG